MIVSESSFPVYDQFAEVMGSKLVKIPLRAYHLDLEAMAESYETLLGRTRFELRFSEESLDEDFEIFEDGEPVKITA